MPANIHDHYRFYYNHPSLGERQCYPHNSTLEFTWEREEDQIFYRKKLEDTLVFVDDVKKGIDDFTQFYSIDRSDQRCSKVFFRIERLCNDSWIIDWEGYLALVDGKFDVDRKVLRIQPRLNDQVSCILDRYDREYNFLEAPDIVNLGHAFGEVETFSCMEHIETFSTRELAEQHVQFLNSQGPREIAVECVNAEGDPVSTPFGFPDTYAPYDAEYIILEVPGEGFKVFWKTSYVREVYVVDCINGDPEDPPGNPLEWLLLEDCSEGTIGQAVYARPIYTFTLEPVSPDFPNGRTLEQVIELLTSDCVSSIKSDFLGINPLGDIPINEAYNYSSTFFQDLILFQNTDIKRPNAAEKATIGIITLEELFEFFRKKWNVFWDVDTDGTLIIEHVSYFQQNQRMLNLTKDSAKQLIVGRHTYSYDNDNLPAKEIWEPTVDVDDEDFSKLTIEYPEACSFTSSSVESNKLKFNTNFQDIKQKPEKYPDEGISIAASYQSLVIWNTKAEFSQDFKLNAPLSLANAFTFFLQYNRPHRLGEVNNEEFQFNSYKRVRLQLDLNVKICCEDLNIFNPKDLAKTQLGWGEITKATLRLPHMLLNVNTLHYA